MSLTASSFQGSIRLQKGWFRVLMLGLIANSGLVFAVQNLNAKEGHDMRVDFECSGGFANLQLRYSADTSELDPAVANQLIQHVNASGLLLMSQKDIAEQPTPPDVINYRIEIEQDGKKKSFSMNDVTAPIAARPLLGFLRKLALEARQPKK